MPMTQPPAARGACYCASVSVTAPSPLRRPVNCHCGECRRLSGAAFTTWITAPRDQVAVDNPEGLSMFSPTPNLQRWFCRQCGSHVFTADARLPRVYGFPAGLFEGEAIEPPCEDYFLDDKANWYGSTA
jgi:hypothetical protein